jgi:hypothetical protein
MHYVFLDTASTGAFTSGGNASGGMMVSKGEKKCDNQGSIPLHKRGIYKIIPREVRNRL